MREARRGADGGARGRGREARSHAGNVFRDRPRPAAAGEMRLRPGRLAQSRKGVSDAAPLCGARTHARAPGKGAVSRVAAILMTIVEPRSAAEAAEAIRAAGAQARRFEIIGSASKARIGRMPETTDKLVVSHLA